MEWLLIRHDLLREKGYLTLSLLSLLSLVTGVRDKGREQLGTKKQTTTAIEVSWICGVGVR